VVAAATAPAAPREICEIDWGLGHDQVSAAVPLARGIAAGLRRLGHLGDTRRGGGHLGGGGEVAQVGMSGAGAYELEYRGLVPGRPVEPDSVRLRRRQVKYAAAVHDRS